jgi:hypothetical protein
MTTAELSIEIDKNLDHLENYLGANHPDILVMRQKFNFLRSQKTVASSQNNSAVSDPLLLEQLKEIRAALNLRGKQVIRYDFLKKNPDYHYIYKQLTVDSLKMENSALKTFDESGHEIHPKQRFISFAFFASMQIETLANLYIGKKYSGNFTNFKKDYDSVRKGYPIDDKITSISRVSLDPKLRFILAWSNRTPNNRLLENVLIIKDIRNGDVHRAVEFDNPKFVIPVNQKLLDILNDPSNPTFHNYVRETLQDFINELIITGIF